MNDAPLIRIGIDLVGARFEALVTPEDDVVRAAGFVGQPDALEQRLIARVPALAERGVRPDAIATGPVAAALHAYANGRLEALNEIAVEQPASPFRGEVWRALREVPPGAPVTYTALAAQAGRPTAIRAAASACASNLIPLIVPCHRIVRSDGSLGGYLFGTELKRRLLEHEASHAAESRGSGRSSRRR